MESPRYQSQPQLLAPTGPQGFYPPAPPQGVIVPQSWAPYQQQHDQRYDSCLNCLFKCSCCFRGTTNIYIKYLSMVLGALVLLHGIIAIIVAGVAFSEAKNFVVNETAVKEMDSDSAKNKTSLPLMVGPTVAAYTYYFALLPGYAIASNGGNVGGLLAACFLTLIFEIFPGACIIVAAVLLKQVYCALSYGALVFWFTENAIEIVLIPVSIVGQVAGPSQCNTSACGMAAILGVVVKFFFLCLIYLCMAAGLTLWEQIRNGIYGPRTQGQALAPAQIPIAGSLVNAATITGQTASTAYARKSIQEPLEQS